MAIAFMFLQLHGSSEFDAGDIKIYKTEENLKTAAAGTPALTKALTKT